MIKVEINYNHGRLVISTHFDFEECPSDLLAPFASELYMHPEIQQELMKRGFITMKEMLPEYLKCRYGGNDNKDDFNGSVTTSDYCHCGQRGSCISEGFTGLCSIASVEGIHISPVEIELVSRLANDQIYKEIANNRGRSFNTVNTQLRKLRDKVHTLRTPALVRKFMLNGLIQENN
jgi:DNA-binding CsgD family transcriptional regulator